MGKPRSLGVLEQIPNNAYYSRLLRYVRLWLYDNALARQIDDGHQPFVILAKAVYQVSKVCLAPDKSDSGEKRLTYCSSIAIQPQLLPQFFKGALHIPGRTGESIGAIPEAEFNFPLHLIPLNPINFGPVTKYEIDFSEYRFFGLDLRKKCFKGPLHSTSRAFVIDVPTITTLVTAHPELQQVSPGFDDQNARFRVYIKNMEDILMHIGKTITCLMRMSIVIQSSAPHRRFFQSHVTRIYEPADISHVAKKYSKSDKRLQERMGKANSYRRQYFKYREAHHYRIAYGSAPDTEGQSTVASSIPKGLDDETLGLDKLRINDPIVAWASSSHTTAYDADHLDFPPIPAMSKHGPFECPFCYMMIAADDQNTWEQHIIHDIRPYLCLDTDCPITDHYQTRREWIEHMKRKQWRIWLCPNGCSQRFKTSKDFRSHILEAHPETWSSRGWDPNFEDACSRPWDSWTDSACPFCVDTVITSQSDYKSHVGEHQLDLSRFVLPRLDDELTEGESTRATESPQTPLPSTPEISSDVPLAGPSSDYTSKIKGRSSRHHDSRSLTRDVHIPHSKSKVKGKKQPSSSASSNMR
ncbi:hypothetical protein PG996_009867 [Apiospora saccharicola]|uniref:C2H2-type domain-containing protein n=1 Tax=Apiospora saccharicola TaxID=335842 RepID=A0ABR1UM05_9PEZI